MPKSSSPSVTLVVDVASLGFDFNQGFVDELHSRYPNNQIILVYGGSLRDLADRRADRRVMPRLQSDVWRMQQELAEMDEELAALNEESRAHGSDVDESEQRSTTRALKTEKLEALKTKKLDQLEQYNALKKALDDRFKDTSDTRPPRSKAGSKLYNEIYKEDLSSLVETVNNATDDYDMVSYDYNKDMVGTINDLQNSGLDSSNVVLLYGANAYNNSEYERHKDSGYKAVDYYRAGVVRDAYSGLSAAMQQLEREQLSNQRAMHRAETGSTSQTFYIVGENCELPLLTIWSAIKTMRQFIRNVIGNAARQEISETEKQALSTIDKMFSDVIKTINDDDKPDDKTKLKDVVGQLEKIEKHVKNLDQSKLRHISQLVTQLVKILGCGINYAVTCLASGVSKIGPKTRSYSPSEAEKVSNDKIKTVLTNRRLLTNAQESYDVVKEAYEVLKKEYEVLKKEYEVAKKDYEKAKKPLSGVENLQEPLDAHSKLESSLQEAKSRLGQAEEELGHAKNRLNNTKSDLSYPEQCKLAKRDLDESTTTLQTNKKVAQDKRAVSKQVGDKWQTHKVSPKLEELRIEPSRIRDKEHGK